MEINQAIKKEHTRLWLRCTLAAAALGITVLVLAHFASPMRIQGSSMLPTLHEGEWVLVNQLNKRPNHGDTVVAIIQNKWIVKRVIGLPGDEIDILADGTVIRNGNIIAEEYALPGFEPCDIALPAIVPENAFFLLGDNREASIDSRSAEVGMVFTDHLIGIVWHYLSNES